MHIDRAHKVTVPREPTGAACPISVLGLVFVPTARTLATRSSFRASEARDVGLFRFVSQIVDIFPVLPQSHALIVMPSAVLAAHTVRIANEERTDVVLDAEVDHLPGGLVPHIADTPVRAGTHLVPGPLQLLPPARILLATRLLLGDLADLSVALPFEAANASSRDDQRFLSVCRCSSKVYLAEIDGSAVFTRHFFGLWGFNADMQFKPSVPHKGHGSTVFGQIERQHQRSTSPSHRQNDAPLPSNHGLSRPRDWVEAFGAPGVFHAHLRVCLAKLARGLNVGKEGMHDHLYRLTLQSKTAFGRLLQFMAPRPCAVSPSGRFVGFHAVIPDLSCLLLSRLQSVKLACREMVEPIYANGLHGMILVWMSLHQVGKTRYSFCCMDSSDGELPGTTTSASTPEPSHREQLEHDRVNLSYARAFYPQERLSVEPGETHCN